jgi:hypothetical protein
MTSKKDFNDALETVSLILLGRRSALQTREVRGDVVQVLDIAEAAQKKDLTELSTDDPDFEIRAKQVTRKLEAIKNLRVLASVLTEFDW